MVSSTVREGWVYSPDKSFISFLKKKIQYPEIRCILRLWWNKKKTPDLGQINVFKLDTHYLYSLQSLLRTYCLLYTTYETGLNIFLEEVHGLNLFT